MSEAAAAMTAWDVDRLRPINDEQDIMTGLEALAKSDPRLGPVIRRAGPVPLRRSSADFEGLARIVVGQQLSVASAQAIRHRLSALLPGLDAAKLRQSDDGQLAGCGLSRAKISTLRAIGAAVEQGLDLAALSTAPCARARAQLMAIKGIGPWSADIYLLFCGGHPDIFPASDLALRRSVGGALNLDPPPGSAELQDIAMAWAPWRSVAARLFWAYYRAQNDKGETVPV